MRRHSLTSLSTAHRPEEVEGRRSSRRLAAAAPSGASSAAPAGSSVLAVLSCLGEGCVEPLEAPPRGAAAVVAPVVPGGELLRAFPSAFFLLQHARALLRGGGAEAADCLICTEALAPEHRGFPGDTTCPHSQFHAACLHTWAGVSSRCPLCKAPFARICEWVLEGPLLGSGGASSSGGGGGTNLQPVHLRGGGARERQQAPQLGARHRGASLVAVRRGQRREGLNT
jgi:hypothetical protein